MRYDRSRGGADPIRTDLSATLFLSAPEEYDGGELIIEDTYGTQQVKLPAGHLVLYPGTSLHRVTPVTRGARVASFFWIQSLLREDAQRRLMFDLDVNELDVVVAGQTNDELIVRIMDAADDNGQTGAVALAVERILTPPPPEYLPRPEKLSPESPRTVIRHYLLAHYSVEQLQALAGELGIDWEQLDAGTKKDKTRALLLYLYRRNRITDLLHVIQAQA